MNKPYLITKTSLVAFLLLLFTSVRQQLLTFLYDVTVIPKVVQKRVHFLPCPPRHQAPQRAYS